MKNCLLSFILLFSITLQCAEISEPVKKCSVKVIDSIQDFQAILKSEECVIINCVGECSHCPLGKSKFKEFIEKQEIHSIKFYEFKVSGKPVIVEQYQINLRPCIICFVNGQALPEEYRLVRSQINAENLTKLIQSILEKLN